MSVGRRARRRARLGGSHRIRLILARAGVAVTAIGLLAAGFGVGARSDSRGEPIRAVLSSLAPAGATKLSTTSLYATNDPWKRYLASERVCPGGERTDLPLASQAHAVACLVNFARSRRGLRELAVASILNGASARKARAILRCRNFAHNPCGTDWTTAVRSTGYAGLFGENLYLASGLFGAPRLAVDAWLNSAPHRQNLFRAEWREQGLAVVALDRFGDQRDVSLWVSMLGNR
jgi:uncharacterized protein YkwD